MLSDLLTGLAIVWTIVTVGALIGLGMREANDRWDDARRWANRGDDDE